jgi:hypothetical protein
VGDAAKFVLAKQKMYGGLFISALNTLMEIRKSKLSLPNANTNPLILQGYSIHLKNVLEYF